MAKIFVILRQRRLSTLSCLTFEFYFRNKTKAHRLVCFCFGASSRTRTYDNDGQKHSRLTRSSLRDTPCFFLSKPRLSLPPAAARLRAVNSRLVCRKQAIVDLNSYLRNKTKSTPIGVLLFWVVCT